MPGVRAASEGWGVMGEARAEHRCETMPECVAIYLPTQFRHEAQIEGPASRCPYCGADLGTAGREGE